MKIVVVTGSRADYGLLRPTIAALQQDERFELVLLATAMHLDDAYGATIQEVEADGHQVTRVPIASPDSGTGFSQRLGSATLAFTQTLSTIDADMLLVLGDRYEVLAAALAATGLEIPIAHMHGGELSEGSLDDATRHCVTKLAHLHFVAARCYGERVCQLGEEPWRVHNVGAAAVESIRSVSLLDLETLTRELGIESAHRPLIAMTLHPTSREPDLAGEEARAVITGVEDVLSGRGTVVLTLPNDDPGSESTRAELLRWAASSPIVSAFQSLGQLRYLSLLSKADAVVGNSSSAIIEAPSFGLPVVNVGERQRGRMMAPNILSCQASADAIAASLRKALDPAFRESLADLASPYGDGYVSTKVLEVLAAAPARERLRDKRFVDLPDGPWRSTLDFGAT